MINIGVSEPGGAMDMGADASLARRLNLTGPAEVHRRRGVARETAHSSTEYDRAPADVPGDPGSADAKCKCLLSGGRRTGSVTGAVFSAERIPARLQASAATTACALSTAPSSVAG